jgi:hypothetical protein
MSRSSDLAKAPVSLRTREPGRRYNPKTLRNVVKWAREMPVIRVICERARVTRAGLAYWIKKSAAGEIGCGDGFDVTINGETRRFHDWYYDAFSDGVDRVEEAAFKLANGTHMEALSYRGRVNYQEDPDLLALGFEGPEAWKRDKNNRPIPEAIAKLDPDMTRFILKAHRPERYINTQKIDVTHKGGVLVVGTQMKREDFEKKFVGKSGTADVLDVEFEVVPTDAPDPTA